MSNIQLVPISVASSTVHSANLGPGFKLSLEWNEIGVSGASALADALRVNQSLKNTALKFS